MIKNIILGIAVLLVIFSAIFAQLQVTEAEKAMSESIALRQQNENLREAALQEAARAVNTEAMNKVLQDKLDTAVAELENCQD